MDLKGLLKEAWPEWKMVRPLGEGSYGKVYHIRRQEFGRTFDAALKVVSIPKDSAEAAAVFAELEDSISVTAYFRDIVEEVVNEFVLMERLKGHTNIVSYEDHKVIPHDEGPGWDILIRMELLIPFTDYMASHEMDDATIARLGIDVCSALELCHRNNILHRDVKPQNIFVSKDGDVKLGDFGVAKMTEGSRHLLSKKGTSSYMAPEVYKGASYNETADIYSLGLVMYRLLNDHREPFMPPAPDRVTFSAREEALYQRMSGMELPRPAHGGKDLQDVVLKACTYFRQERYQSAGEMKKALTDLFEEMPPRLPVTENRNEIIEEDVGEMSDPTYDPSRKRDVDETGKSGSGKLPLIIGITVLAIAAVCLALVMLVRREPPQPQPPLTESTVEARTESVEGTEADPEEAPEAETSDRDSGSTLEVSILKNPEIKKDASMKAGQKVTWDCLYLGNYPGTEIVDQAGTCGSRGKQWGQTSDYEEDRDLYQTLEDSKEWDKAGDITIEGIRYRRIRQKDAAQSREGNEDYYDWDGEDRWHYFRYEPIKWRVLQVSGGKALLLADQALDDRVYHVNDVPVTWEASTIRSWLNGYPALENEAQTDYSRDSFVDRAFTREEKKYIVKSSQKESGTKDRIFLLSEEEVSRTERAGSYGFCQDAGREDEARPCRSTTYTKAMGIYSSEQGESGWWLRSSGDGSRTTSYVRNFGYLREGGRDVTYPRGGVRPALCLDLEQDSGDSTVWTYAGTVCSDGTVEEE